LIFTFLRPGSKGDQSSSRKYKRHEINEGADPELHTTHEPVDYLNRVPQILCTISQHHGAGVTPSDTAAVIPTYEEYGPTRHV